MLKQKQDEREAIASVYAYILVRLIVKVVRIWENATSQQ